MQIVHIIAGSGGSFYCQNCVKDTSTIIEQRRLGHDVTVIPMYLPSFPDNPTLAGNTPTFFGAVNIYLKHTLSWWGRMPHWIHRIFDSKLILKLIAPFSGPTKAEGLESLTISMLQGEQGVFADEVEQVLDWIQTELSPDIIHISNALLLGLAHELKQRTQAKIVCSLQDEDHWINSMAPDFKKRTWQLISDKAQFVDRFIAVSNFYAHKVASKTSIDLSKISTVYPGIDNSAFAQTTIPDEPAVIGFLSRFAGGLGLETVIDAFILLKKQPEWSTLKLSICGGMTHADHHFFKQMKKKIKEASLNDDVTITMEHDIENRRNFLQNITLLTVPPAEGDAIGVYLLEALAAGVPVVQPDIGGFGEVVQISGGGTLYSRNDSEHLATALEAALSDKEELKAMSERGRHSVETVFSSQTAAQAIDKIYNEVIDENHINP